MIRSWKRITQAAHYGCDHEDTKLAVLLRRQGPHFLMPFYVVLVHCYVRVNCDPWGFEGTPHVGRTDGMRTLPFVWASKCPLGSPSPSLNRQFTHYHGMLVPTGLHPLTQAACQLGSVEGTDEIPLWAHQPVTAEPTSFFHHLYPISSGSIFK